MPASKGSQLALHAHSGGPSTASATRNHAGASISQCTRRTWHCECRLCCCVYEAPCRERGLLSTLSLSQAARCAAGAARAVYTWRACELFARVLRCRKALQEHARPTRAPRACILLCLAEQRVASSLSAREVERGCSETGRSYLDGKQNDETRSRSAMQRHVLGVARWLR